MYTQFLQSNSHIELITLVSLGSVSKVSEILAHEKWDPSVRNEDGITPALKAAERNDYEMLTELVKYGAKVDVPDMMGFTPLKYAKQHNNHKMIKLIQDELNKIKIKPNRGGL